MLKPRIICFLLPVSKVIKVFFDLRPLAMLGEFSHKKTVFFLGGEGGRKFGFD